MAKLDWGPTLSPAVAQTPPKGIHAAKYMDYKAFQTWVQILASSFYSNRSWMSHLTSFKFPYLYMRIVGGIKRGKDLT